MFCYQYYYLISNHTNQQNPDAKDPTILPTTDPAAVPTTGTTLPIVAPIALPTTEPTADFPFFFKASSGS